MVLFDMSKELLAQLEGERAQMTTRIFRLGLEIAFVFAVPALFVAFVIRPLLASDTLTFILLGCAFVGSWIVVLIRYKKTHTKMHALDMRIKALRLELEEQKASQ
ncbi:MAG: hypothetical protein LRY41_00100 [Candidatus Pacebacteria bacterium]|nr:hypothetical protein [Candidatus Paceibacterota bacterium]MCD8527738.1 hypothetical protein [Candidatus Paceibacterota bacterium]MCD8563487.1 hypothetical protein [Candidatus Paceibacterota bacterium]